MILIFIVAVAPLSFLAARRGAATTNTPATTPIRQEVVSTVTETITQIATQSNDSTTITTQMLTSLQTITKTSIRTLSSQPKSTSSTGDSCDNKKVFLAPKFCVIVTEYTQAKLDAQANDCKEFCDLQADCKKGQSELTGHLKDCCGHCGCL
jgi:hypothetical protein